MYHCPAENDYIYKKNVSDINPKFHFLFQTASSGESTMA